MNSYFTTDTTICPLKNYQIFTICHCVAIEWQNHQHDQLGHLMTKPTKWHVRPANTQISLGIHPVWWGSSFCKGIWAAACQKPTKWPVPSEDTDQPDRSRQMPRLIWVFNGHTYHFAGFVIQRLIYTNKFLLYNQIIYKLLFDHCLWAAFSPVIILWYSQTDIILVQAVTSLHDVMCHPGIKHC